MVALPWCQGAEDAAIDGDGLRSDVARAIGQEETYELRRLICRPDATQWHIAAEPLADRLDRCGGIELQQHRRLDQSGQHAVDAHVAWRGLGSRRAREANHGMLGGN